MKAIALFILLAAVLCANAQLVTNQPARLKMKLIAYEGKIGVGAYGATLNPTPEVIRPGDGGSDEVTSSGKESKLTWAFVGRNGSNDVYQVSFTRKIKSNSTLPVSGSKTVKFDGRKIVIFEDELHTVVMESPSEADLKSALKH